MYHEATISICPKCDKQIPAKILIKDKVYLEKRCPEHGKSTEILEDDIEYYLRRRDYDKEGTKTPTQTETVKGCPFDCGLCPEHDQHTCIGLIEITSRCNTDCKECYSKKSRFKDLCLEQVEKMLDFYTEVEDAEIVQISGGEPTLHPQIIDILKLAYSKKIKYIMLNTNGLDLSKDLIEVMASFRGRFEVYLQWNNKNPAIEKLLEKKIPVTLVSTINNSNIKKVRQFFEYGLKAKGVRGINFQPVAYYSSEPEENRITMTRIMQELSKTKELEMDDFVPLPCNVERVGITYLIKSEGSWMPITKKVNVKSYLNMIDNTFAFDADTMTCKCMSFIKNFALNFQNKSKDEKLEACGSDIFRVSVTSFLDKYNFDMKSMQKECVHVITPELKRIPFSAYNIFYRR